MLEKDWSLAVGIMAGIAEYLQPRLSPEFKYTFGPRPGTADLSKLSILTPKKRKPPLVEVAFFVELIETRLKLTTRTTKSEYGHTTGHFGDKRQVPMTDKRVEQLFNLNDPSCFDDLVAVIDKEWQEYRSKYR